MKFTMTDEARRACEVTSGLDYQTLQSASLENPRGSIDGRRQPRTLAQTMPRGSVYLQLGRISSREKAQSTIRRFE